MPMIYTSSLATPGNSATSGSANTEVGTIALKTAANGRSVALQACYVIGKGAGLTAISGIGFRVMRVTTASTSGTATTPRPKDTGHQAATGTAVTGQTISTTGRTDHVIFGCGAAGPGGWVAPNPDSVILLAPAATIGSIDLLNVSGTVSLNYEFSIEHVE